MARKQMKKRRRHRRGRFAILYKVLSMLMICAAIVAANNPSVDAVTGATLTSNRIMNAAAQCLEAAAK